MNAFNTSLYALAAAFLLRRKSIPPPPALGRVPGSAFAWLARYCGTHLWTLWIWLLPILTFLLTRSALTARWVPPMLGAAAVVALACLAIGLAVRIYSTSRVNAYVCMVTYFLYVVPQINRALPLGGGIDGAGNLLAVWAPAVVLKVALVLIVVQLALRETIARKEVALAKIDTILEGLPEAVLVVEDERIVRVNAEARRRLDLH
jgi:hypothetical protein